MGQRRVFKCVNKIDVPPPFSPVLAVGTWFAEINLTDIVVYILPAAGDVLPVGLHVELLDVGGKAEEGLGIG